MAGNCRTRREMLSASYKFLSHARCKSCDAPIEWWLTTNQKRIPMDPIGSDTEQAVPHWGTCPSAFEHRDEKPGTALPKPPAADPKTDMRRAAADLRTRFNAIAVVLIHEDGGAYDYRKGVDAEELRNDVIAAGNHMRNHIRKAATT